MKNKMKKLIAVIVGVSIMLKEKLVKATNIDSWIPPQAPNVPVYGVPKTAINGIINVITDILVFLGVPIVLILGLNVYIKKGKQTKNKSIIVQIFGRLILAISLFLSFVTVFTILDYDDYTDYFLEEFLILVIMMIAPITIFRYLIKNEIIKNKEKNILRMIMLLLLLSVLLSVV